MAVIWALLWIFLIGYLLTGCTNLRKDVETPTLTPTQQLSEAVKSTNWLVTVSILGVALSVAAFFNGGGKLALSALLGSSVLLVLSITVAKYAWLIAVLGLVLGVVALGYIIWLRRKALIEIVDGVQTARESESETLLDKYLNNQSKTTKKIVKQIKESIK